MGDLHVPGTHQSADIHRKRFKGDRLVKSVSALQFGADFCRGDVLKYGQVTYFVGESIYFVNELCPYCHFLYFRLLLYSYRKGYSPAIE
jgi:hypothetical protein